jgi:hypothetical protein
MTKNYIFLYSQNPDAQKIFTLPLYPYFIFLSRIRLWIRKFFILLKFRLSNYFLMVKNFFYQLISAQKFFTAGGDEIIFKNFEPQEDV